MASWFLCTKTHWKMSGLPNLTYVNTKGEQKALWNKGGRKAHICVTWREKTDQKKTEKEMDFKAPTAHGERKWNGRGFDRVSLWGLLSEHRAEGGGVCVHACVAHMGVYLCVLYGFKCVWVKLTGVAEQRPITCRHPAACQSAVWEMTAIWTGEFMQGSIRWVGAMMEGQVASSWLTLSYFQMTGRN